MAKDTKNDKDKKEEALPGPIVPPLSEEQVLSEMSNSQREDEGLVEAPAPSVEVDQSPKGSDDED